MPEEIGTYSLRTTNCLQNKLMAQQKMILLFTLMLNPLAGVNVRLNKNIILGLGYMRPVTPTKSFLHKLFFNLILHGNNTYRKMIQNLMWATGYNVVALPLAAGVLYKQGILLSPGAGAVLMTLSTVIVAINAICYQ